ncbi:uncharacterized protein F4807DRAFT_8126 [Annulohypoxylon truncatum]|uniref:uncharacterized protein n=1 Tax=Annulohypoxylon truncatum TaxID=327061 RepID=UPI002008B3A1|nr:uncharacterized protein F4807DRAFT_8126 [Annulohypoxylon truncatum]KAI1214768.1 hypothetical protein F4807DRAFT_8126 [Annulohypoxylon truncatum]
MKVCSVITFASSILAAVIRSPPSLVRPAGLIANQTRPVYFKRDDIRVLCGDPPDYPNTEFPTWDYSYPIGMLLSGGSRRIHLEAGPRKCIQAACNAGGGAGVFICNDQHNSIDVLYTDAGWFAQQVYSKCKQRRDGTDYVEKGQAFCPDNWNVILSDVGDECTASTLPNLD